MAECSQRDRGIEKLSTCGTDEKLRFTGSTDWWNIERATSRRGWAHLYLRLPSGSEFAPSFKACRFCSCSTSFRTQRPMGDVEPQTAASRREQGYSKSQSLMIPLRPAAWAVSSHTVSFF